MKQKSQKHYLVLYQLKKITFSSPPHYVSRGKNGLISPSAFTCHKIGFKRKFIWAIQREEKRVINLVPETEYYFYQIFKAYKILPVFLHHILTWVALTPPFSSRRCSRHLLLSSTILWYELHRHLPFHPGGALGIYSYHPVWSNIFYKLSYDFC